MNEMADIGHFTDIDDSNIQSASGLIIRKTRPKLRLKVTNIYDSCFLECYKSITSR